MIIGICGFQGAGKDTVGDILVKSHGFVRLSFGSALKDAVSILFGWDREMLEGLTPESRTWREQVDEYWSDKLNDPTFTPRKALQTIGTNVFRDHFHTNMWVDIVENKINQLVKLNPDTRIVICDCRFDNEFAMIKKFPESKIIHVQRNEPEWFEDFRSNGFVLPPGIILHPSEIQWMRWNFDHTLANKSTLDKLELDVLRLVENKTMDFTCVGTFESTKCLKNALEKNSDWESFYKIRMFLVKYSQIIARLNKSKISDHHLGYYKTLVYNDWTSDQTLHLFDSCYRSYICSMLNAIKNKEIEGRTKLN
jgi:hypothetical protein